MAGCPCALLFRRELIMLLGKTGLNLVAVGALLTLLVGQTLLLQSALAEILRVDPGATGTGEGDTWGDAFTSLQAAINEAADGDAIWIRGGTYKPTTGSDRSASFVIGTDVTLYGGFAGDEDFLIERDILANPTILSGDLNGDDTSAFGNRGDNSYHVVRVANVGNFAILDGLIIRGGNADGTSPSNQAGGGVLIIETTPTSEIRVVVRELSIIEECSALGSGGAAGGEAAGMEIRDALIRGNRALGGGSPVTSDGGAFSLGYLRATQSRFEDNACDGCLGGALALNLGENSEASSLVSVEFIENMASGEGGAVLAVSAADFANCLFAGNTAGTDHQTGPAEGGGLYVKFGATVTNCTIADNLAHNEYVNQSTFEVGMGGGLSAGVGSDVRIRNTVLWGNRVDIGSGPADSHFAQTNVYPSGSSVSASPIAYALIENYFGCVFCPSTPPDYVILGDDLLLHDPIFADPSADNYRHRTIWITDVGDDGSLPEDVNDLDGDTEIDETLPLDLPRGARVRDMSVDLGAYEWCIGDLDGDGEVGGSDLGLLLSAEGECPTTAPCLGDLDGDGDVGGADLGVLLANWECGGESTESLTGGLAGALMETLGVETLEELWEGLLLLEEWELAGLLG